MAAPKIFVSSTCYDLNVVRGQLRNFIAALGYDPIMSDYSDVLFDPRLHTHTSCLKEIPNCDVVVVIIGSRFGGKGVPEAISAVDYDALKKQGYDISALRAKENLSITQIEVLKAIESAVPVFAFVDTAVFHDHNLYEKNKGKSIIDEISFPSIEKPETAKYIFEFINFLRHRVRGNSITEFARMEDIEDHLRTQWASLFQRLLSEQRQRGSEERRIDHMSEQFESLKAAILASIDSGDAREIARGVVRYRRLFDLLRGLPFSDISSFEEECPFDELLGKAGVTKLVEIPERRGPFGGRTAFVRDDGTFHECRLGMDTIASLQDDWDAFSQLGKENKRIIIDALGEMDRSGLRLMRRSEKQFDALFSNADDDDHEEVDIAELMKIFSQDKKDEE